MTYNQKSTFRVVHTLYIEQILSNDVALVRLPVEASGRYIATIAIAPKTSGSFAGDEVQASGFGLTTNNGSVSNTLNKVTLIVVTNEECRKTYGFLTVTSSTLCAKYNTRKGQSTCNGDSGGPLVGNENGTPLLEGVTSFVSGAGCDSGELAGFSRVSSFYDWIETNTKKYENSDGLFPFPLGPLLFI